MVKMPFTRNYIVIFFILSFISCQEEKREFINPNEDNTIPQSSLLSKLLKNVVTHDGSFDDDIDGGHCYSIVLPYTILKNGQQVIINQIEDYNSIQISDAIEIQFPIEITMHNYKQKTITGIIELIQLSSTCSMIDDDIECIDFLYPIQISTFNSNTNALNTFDIFHDAQLYNFIEEVDEFTVLSMNYPIDLLLYDGQKIIATHNTELQSQIVSHTSSCNEND